MTANLLIDGFGRVATDLRISVTDRCNFRCTYCMPAEGMKWLPREGILSFEEIDRLAGVFMSLGVRTFRLTGGEPLARRDLPWLVEMLAAREPDDIALTTNGAMLAAHAADLKRAGLHRVNVSLDSLLRHRFAEMTRRDALDAVMAGLRAAREAGLEPIKVNCVVIGGTNSGEVVDFARLARETGYEIRFIEFMPLDADERWSLSSVVPSREVLAAIDAVFPLVAVPREHEPANVFRFADGAPGNVGVIPSVTEPFCSSCDRVRITADGQFRACLFSLEELDLRALLRGGCCDGEIAAAVRTAVAGKWAGHSIGARTFRRPQRSMSAIGG
jgi:cyclic pyranopterin phosphate synthase